MTNIVDFAINRTRMILAIFLSALIAGLISFITLPKEADPDVNLPFVLVVVPLDGVSPEDAERLIVRPTETEMRAIEGLQELDSTASLGSGTLVAEFDVTFNVDEAMVDVREAVDMARREYPQDVREPVVQEINFAQAPAIVVHMYGDAPERALYRATRNLQDELEALPQVLEANMRGAREELLEIVIDPARLEAYGINYVQLFNAIQANNQLVAAGTLESGEARFQVKVPGLLESVEDALNLPISTSGDAVVTMQDVADVRRTFKDRDSFSRYNGAAAFSLEVVRRPTANILDMTEAVRERAEVVSANWPGTINHDFSLDQSTYVRDSLGSLTSSIFLAIILVMILVVAALGLRSAMLVGIAIPSSFLFSFLLLNAYGMRVNFMVMFAMVLAVGILVDGAIVVVEYADRKLAEGLRRKEAYRMAGKRMFWPIVSSTATTLAAFVPFLFWNSIEGQFMAYLPITLIFVLTSSLAMALIFLPTLGSVIGKKPKPGETDSAVAQLSAADGGDPTQLPGFTGLYASFIGALVKRPLFVALAAVGLVFATFTAFGAKEHRVEQFLDVEPEEIYVFIRARGNLSPAEQYELALEAESRISNIEGIKGYATTAGDMSGSPFDGTSAPPQDSVARIFIEFLPYAERRSGYEIDRDIREAMAGMPGVLIEIRKREQGPPIGKDVQVELRSNNGPALSQASAAIRDRMNAMDGLIDYDDTLPLPGIEWRISVDREEAGRYGADVAQVGAAVQLVTNGALVGRYRPDNADEEVDIRVRFPEDARDITRLDDLRINTQVGMVPLSNFVRRDAQPRVDSIQRRDGQRIVTLRANAAEGEAGNLLRDDLRAWIDVEIAAGRISEDVAINFGGADESSNEAIGFFGGAMMAMMFMMGVILLWQFNNFWHVFLTLQAVLLSVVGVLIGILVSFPYISILFVGTGVVTLAGIVVNNNIVLIDTFQRLRALGMEVDKAIVQTAAQRLRPVLLTTITTIFGLLPMVFQINANFGTGELSIGGPASEWWVQLSSAVVWGLGFATLLTLLLTPVMLGVPTRLGNLRRKLIGPTFLDGKPEVDVAETGEAQPAE
jgi:multidrug efflux pump